MKPENTKTELGVIAVCVAAGAAFLGVAANIRGSFGPDEWWWFILVALGWLSSFTISLFWLHSRRAELAERHKTVEQQRLITENFAGNIILLLQNLKELGLDASLTRKIEKLSEEPVQPPEGNGDHGKAHAARD